VGARIRDSFHEKEGSVKTNDAAGIAKNSRGTDVWPVVNDALHQVNIRTLGYGVEEITTHNLTACCDFVGQNLGRAGHHLRQIEQDTVKPWRGIKNGPEQRRQPEARRLLSKGTMQQQFFIIISCARSSLSALQDRGPSGVTVRSSRSVAATPYARRRPTLLPSPLPIGYVSFPFVPIRLR